MDLPCNDAMTVATWAPRFVETLSQVSGFPHDVLSTLRSQAAALAQAAPPQTVADRCIPQIVRRPEDLPALAAALTGADAVAVDLETSSLDHRQGEIVGIGLAIPDGSYYLPTGHRDSATGQLLPDQVSTREVVQQLKLGDLPLVAHNAQYEFKWLRSHSGIEPRFMWDTMLAAQLLRSDLPCGLKELVVRDLDVPDWGLVKKDLEKIQFLPIDRVARYCAKDCWYTLELMEKQKACLA